MPRRRGGDEEPVVDPTGWMISSDIAKFMIVHTDEIKYMCMLAYAFYHGSKVFSKCAPGTPISYKIVSMILACTGGGIFVPVFINKIPVPLSIDAYPIAICASFLIHQYIPVMRDVMQKSALFKSLIIFMYEITRAYVVVKFTSAAGEAIPASDFSIPVFGPIFCGALAGCGGAFLPLDKGLTPLKDGLAPNMLTALIAAAYYHIFTNTSLSDGVIDSAKKAHFAVAMFFVIVGFISTFNIDFASLFGKKSDSEKEKDD